MSHHRLDPRRATIAAATVAGLLGLVVVPAHAQAPTNAAPRIDGPTLLTTDVNKPIKLDAGLSDDGVVRDPDLTVTVAGGTLDLAEQPGLTITGDRSNAVTAAGPVGALDKALEKAVVTPDRGFEGTVALHLAAGDGALTTQADLYVDVRRGGLPDVQLKPLGGVDLPAGSEIAAFDKRSGRAVVVAGTSTMASIVDLSRPNRPRFVKTVDLSAFGGALFSVAIRNGVAAIAVINSPKTEPGTLVFIDLDGRILTNVQVGANPDMVSWTPDGDTILVANEGEPECVVETTYVDPEGSVSIVDVDHGVKRLEQSDVTTADFGQFDAAALRAEGVRIFDLAASAAADLEPEYIAVDEDSRKAWVTIQENNAIGLLDLRNGEFTDLVPLGFKDHLLPGNGLDASDRDGGNIIVPQPVLGMYQPDAIAAFESRDHRTYTVSANEGDVLEWEGCVEEEERVNDHDETVPDGTYGRLAVTNAVPYDGNPANGLYSFGARSFSIRDVNGGLVWDSGDTLERLTADLLPAFFNVSNQDPPERDSRSDAKGPEPEGATVLHAYGRAIALVGLERVGGIMAFDVTRPTAPQWLEWETSTFDFNNVEGDRCPEGLSVIDAKDSPTGRPLVVATYELSNTLQVFEVTGRR